MVQNASNTYASVTNCEESGTDALSVNTDNTPLSAFCALLKTILARNTSLTRVEVNVYNEDKKTQKALDVLWINMVDNILPSVCARSKTTWRRSIESSYSRVYRSIPLSSPDIGSYEVHGSHAFYK